MALFKAVKRPGAPKAVAYVSKPAKKIGRPQTKPKGDKTLTGVQRAAKTRAAKAAKTAKRAGKQVASPAVTQKRAIQAATAKKIAARQPRKSKL